MPSDQKWNVQLLKQVISGLHCILPVWGHVFWNNRNNTH